MRVALAVEADPDLLAAGRVGHEGVGSALAELDGIGMAFVERSPGHLLLDAPGVRRVHVRATLGGAHAWSVDMPVRTGDHRTVRSDEFGLTQQVRGGKASGVTGRKRRTDRLRND